LCFAAGGAVGERRAWLSSSFRPLLLAAIFYLVLVLGWWGWWWLPIIIALRFAGAGRRRARARVGMPRWERGYSIPPLPCGVGMPMFGTLGACLACAIFFYFCVFYVKLN